MLKFIRVILIVSMNVAYFFHLLFPGKKVTKSQDKPDRSAHFVCSAHSQYSLNNGGYNALYIDVQ